MKIKNETVVTGATIIAAIIAKIIKEMFPISP